jgi:hypothetical protein
MAANGVLITNTVTVTWDGGPQRLIRGTILDSPAGGALLTAIGGANYTALTSQQQGTTNPGPDASVFRSNAGTEPYNAGQV